MRFFLKSNSQISVVIATHNRDNFLKEAIYSAINQIYPPLEILVSDNVPSKDTELIVKEISSNCTIPIHYFPHDMKGKSSISMNLAVSKAKGIFIAFLNDDDVWEPSYLKKTFELILKKKSKVVYTWFSDWHLNEKKPGKKLDENLEMRDFLLKNPGCVISNLIVNKDLFVGIGGFDEYIHPSNDKDFVMRILFFGYKYNVLRENLVNLRRHEFDRETDISVEFLRGMKKFFKKHDSVANFTTKIKFLLKYYFLLVKSKKF